MLCKITITDETLGKLNSVSDEFGLDFDYERVIQELINEHIGNGGLTNDD